MTSHGSSATPNRYDLMADPLVPVLTPGGNEHHDLPGVFRALMTDRVEAFPGLAAHQAAPLFHFLVQTSAMALLRSRSARPADDAEARGVLATLTESDWRGLLEDLTPGVASTAWSLVVQDPTKPALLQPPTERSRDYGSFAETADALDVLVLAKNHDRKQARAVGAGPHQWFYSLVTLQTAQGYSGRGQPGIARMNGGLSSRLLVDRRPGGRWGPRVLRGIRMLLARRREVLEAVADGVFKGEGGLMLLWLESWDTDESLSVAELDPYFVEVCRRLRLVRTEAGDIAARARPAKRNRVDAKALKGRIGDPWIPIKRDGSGAGEARTIGAGGLGYRVVQQIVLREKPLALRALPGEAGVDSELHLAVLVRGQGKTEGLFERVIPLPASVEIGEGDAELAEIAQEMTRLAAEAEKTLRHAVIVYLQGPEAPNFRRKDARRILGAFDRRVDAEFFPRLFGAVGRPPGAILEEWQVWLRRLAEDSASRVWGRWSPPRARREKARTASEAVLFGGLRKHLPNAFRPRPEEVSR